MLTTLTLLGFEDRKYDMQSLRMDGVGSGLVGVGIFRDWGDWVGVRLFGGFCDVFIGVLGWNAGDSMRHLMPLNKFFVIKNIIFLLLHSGQGRFFIFFCIFQQYVSISLSSYVLVLAEISLKTCYLLARMLLRSFLLWIAV